MIKQSDGVAAPDPQYVTEADRVWRRFYVIGGVSAALYLIVAIVVPAVLTFILLPRFWDVLDDAQSLLPWLTDHLLGWHVVQATTLEGAIFAIIAFVALWLVLRHLDPVWSAIGAIVAVTSQILSMAYYPVLLGLAFLAEQYPTASAERQRDLVAAAEGLVAQNSGFNPIYEGLLGVGVLILSIVMVRGTFPRWVGYLGVLTGIAAVAALVLHPILGLAYLLWWLFFLLWFIAVAWYLVRLGRHVDP